MPKFNLELLKSLILNLGHTHFKRRRLGIFIVYQKCQYLSKESKSPPTCQCLYLGKISFCSIICFEHTLDPGLKPLECVESKKVTQAWKMEGHLKPEYFH